MKLLISAYACEPGKGSEPEAGWEWVAAAGRVASAVVVLTRRNNQEAIESVDRFSTNIHFVYFDLEPLPRRLKKILPYGTQLYYLVWQLRSRQIVRRLHKLHQFDLTHHLTFAVDWMPTGCAIPRVPFVWGPVGGATGLPWRLWRSQGARGILREVCREAFSRSLRAVFGKRLARRADVTLVQNLDQKRQVSHHSRRVIVEPNVVVDPRLGANVTVPKWFGTEGFLEAVFVGRLIPHKGLVFAIQALAFPKVTKWRLSVVGEGPELSRCAHLASQLGVESRVRFLGRIPRHEVAALLRQADAMMAPSMYEGSGFALAEAVTLGCPVVSTRRGGPEVIVTPGAGQLVEADKQISAHLADALARLNGRCAPQSRWTADRLPGFLLDTYRLALDGRS